MIPKKPCKHCNKMGHYPSACFTIRKPIKKIGRRGLVYKYWRDNVAIPYLTAKYGYKCAICGSQGKLDINHRLKRGSHPHLKMSLDNIEFLCRTCHIDIT